MRAGLIAGSIAAIVGVLVNLPLHAPSDAFNSAPVMAGSLVVGLSAGLLWHILEGRAYRPAIFTTSLVLGFGLVSLIALVGETRIDRFVSYFVPLAAIAFGLTGTLTVLLSRFPLTTSWWLTFIAFFLAVGLGIGLAGQSDQQSGRLELPLRVITGVSLEEYEDITFIVSEGSEATFTVEEKLAKFPLRSETVMRTTALSGEVYLDGRSSIIQIDLHQLSSDQKRRDSYVKGQMFHVDPIATFTLSDVGLIPDALASGDEVTTRVTGSLKIRDVTVPLEFDIAARDDGDLMFILGRTSFTWGQLGIRPPNTAVASVENEVRVEVLLAVMPEDL